MSEFGDMDGKELAKRVADCMGDAARAVAMGEAFVQMAGLDLAGFKALRAEIKGYEAEARIRATGSGRSRRKTRARTGLIAADPRSRNLLFVDESGQSHAPVVDPEGNPNGYGHGKHFALAGISMLEEWVEGYEQRADHLKQEFFRRKDITFHEPSMRNRKGAFHFGGDTRKQLAFEERFRNLIKETPFVAFGVCIRFDALRAVRDIGKINEYLPLDVYGMAIAIMIERYFEYLAGTQEQRVGRVVFESQGFKEDVEHQLHYAYTLLRGTQWHKPIAFLSAMEPGCQFIPKQGSNPTEIADLISREVYEWVSDDFKKDPPYWDTLRDKWYKAADGSDGRFGLKVYPSFDIRELIEAHRAQCVGRNW